MPNCRLTAASMSRVENRRSGFSLPVAADEAFASSPQSGLAWLCFLFSLIEPDRRISRIRLSEKGFTLSPDTFGLRDLVVYFCAPAPMLLLPHRREVRLSPPPKKQAMPNR